MRTIVIALVLTLLTACASQNNAPERVPAPDEENGFHLLEAGVLELSRNAKRAKEDYFDVVIADCDAAYKESDKRLYFARTSAETLFYLLKSASEDQPAEVLEVPCSEAHYLAAYASLDLGNVSEAELHLTRALHWSPVNPLYTSELAHIRQIQRDWNGALTLFLEAEDNTKAFSPDDVQEIELARAKRGIGYSLIELGRLDEAEAKFLECLEIDQDDEAAKHELAYIGDLRTRSGK